MVLLNGTVTIYAIHKHKGYIKLFLQIH